MPTSQNPVGVFRDGGVGAGAAPPSLVLKGQTRRPQFQDGTLVHGPGASWAPVFDHGTNPKKNP